jgi:hypothetical protein
MKAMTKSTPHAPAMRKTIFANFTADLLRDKRTEK